MRLRFSLTDRITGVPCRPVIDGAAIAPRRVLGHVRCHVHAPAFSYKVPRIVTLVRANGNPSLRPHPFQHHQRSAALSRAIHLKQLSVDNQPVCGSP